MEVPPEPLNIKEAIRQRVKLCGSNDVCIRMAVWFGNQLPAYLWSNWRNQLIGRGVSWQGLLSVFRDHVNDVVKWVMDQASWKEFVTSMINDIENRYKTRSITDYL
ncbi:MAG: hypothetical protein ACP5NY_00400 [Thermocladium sp.]